MTATRTAYRTCPLCEATCGLEVTLRPDGNGGEEVQRIRGDMADVFSKGFLCPKGSTLKHLHEDPDRLRRPLVKRDGVHVEVSWDEAWEEVAARFDDYRSRHGRDTLAAYIGNPNAHNLSAMLYLRLLLSGLGTKVRFSASTVDQMPRHVASGLVFGSPVAIAVPDLDRADHLILLGANPYASNGSMCTAPDFPGRLEAIRARGGKVVVVDPRRSTTAEHADEWIPIRPGTDALLLAAMAHVILADGGTPGAHVEAHPSGLDDVRAALAPFGPAAVAAATGVDAATIERLARELAAAPSGSVYGRIGTSTTQFGTTTSWLIDVVNIVSGNFDRPGGAMFAMPVAGGGTTHGTPGSGKGFTTGRAVSRVSGYPEVMGEFPAAALGEEITTPGEGQVRALVTVAGNPVLSTPDSAALDAALDELELMISVDIYLNETTRHADVILPPPSQLQRSHYDVMLNQFTVRNVANYSPAVLPLDEGQPDEWEILAKLGMIAHGAGADADPAVADDTAIAGLVQSAVRHEWSNVHGRDPDELLAELASTGRTGPERMVDFMLRSGPFGEGFGANPDGASLDLLLANPHGVDFGALEPRLPGVLRTPSGRIELAAPALIADLDRLGAAITDFEEHPMVMIGRRHLRSNNSWMHNVKVLVKGKPRCTLHVHPDDADRLGLTDGGPAAVTSLTGTVTVPVEVTDAIRPGVVSMPHGWGHGVPGTRMSVAAEHAGVNSNVLADATAMDPLSGTSVLNGIPVEVVPAG